MTSQRMPVSAWDRSRNVESRAGFRPVSAAANPFERNAYASPSNSFNASLSPSGSGRPPTANYDGPNTPTTMSYMQSPSVRSRAVSFSGNIPLRSAYSSSQIRSIAAPDPYNSPNLEMSRELGRLETIVETYKRELSVLGRRLNEAESTIASFERENNRLRKERDDARRVVDDTQNQLNQIRQTDSSRRSSQSAQGTARTPQMQQVVPQTPNSTFTTSVRTSRHSASSSLSVTRISSTPDTPSPRTLAAPVRRSSLAQAVIFEKQPIRENFTSLFWKVEKWAEQYAVLAMSTTSKDPNIKALVEHCARVCRDRTVDDLIDSTPRRRFLIAAVINERLCGLFNPSCIDGYMTPTLAEVSNIKHDLSQARPSNARSYHELLQVRADVYSRISHEPPFQRWLDHQIATTASLLMRLLHPMIPLQSQHAALSDISKLVRDSFQIALRMLTTSCDWAVQGATRGDRWEPNSMVQRDETLTGDARLTENNGFAFVVRLGVAPSVTEKNYSRGVVVAQEQHRKVVLLMENANQKAKR